MAEQQAHSIVIDRCSAVMSEAGEEPVAKVIYMNRIEQFTARVKNAFKLEEPTQAKDVEDATPTTKLSDEDDPDDVAVVDRAINGNAALERPKNGKIMSVFLILNTMIGSGVIAIPYVFMSTGIVVGVFTLIITAILTWIGIIVLIDVGIDQNVFDYTDLAKKAFGQFGVWNVNIWIFIGNIGGKLAMITLCLDVYLLILLSILQL